MIARQESSANRVDVWAQISAPVPAAVVQWRQNGKAKQRDGKFYAPFVAYIDAQFVRERLDTAVPGEWDLHLESLPALVATGGDGEANEEPIAFKARLSILGVIREDVGSGRDYKTASTDAFKRAAVRFGVAHELYTDYEILWVQVDGDGRYARPVEDPAQVWMRKQNGAGVKSANAVDPSRGQRAESGSGGDAAVTTTPARQQPAPASPASAPSEHPGDEASCPKCGGRMWDNRLSKRNPKQPDFKCRTRSCDGVIWPPRSSDKAAKGAPRADEPERFDDPPPYDDSLPF